MSILFRTRTPAKTDSRSYTLGQLGMMLSATASKGAPSVGSLDEALRVDAFWAAIAIKSKGIATLPIDQLRVEPTVRVPVPLSPVIARPDPLVFRRVWVHQLASSMFTDGNAFGQVVSESMGRPSVIRLLDPAHVTNRDVVDGRKVVDYDGRRLVEWPTGDLWHVPGEMVLAGSPFGLSVVEYASKVLGTSLAAQGFGGGFFRDGAIPPAILAPERDPGPEGAAVLKQRFMAAVGGNREPVVLPQSVKYERIQVDPEDSQFIELLRFNCEQVARFTGVPPSMIYTAVSGQSVTYANVTDADLQYLKHTLSYPIDLIEDALFELVPRPHIVRFNRDKILRADAKGRWEVHEMRLRNRASSVNEVRALEDEAPFDDPAFDEPGVPPMREPEGEASSDDSESDPGVSPAPGGVSR